MGLRADITGFAGFLGGLPAFVRQRMTEPRAREIVRRRMQEREQNFLNSLELFVYGNPRSPYRHLLDAAQCTFGDVRTMLASDGLEATLRALRAADVYVAFDEFKGLRPIVRDGRVIEARAEDFDNPNVSRYHKVTTGGSTGRARNVLLDLEHMNARLAMHLLGDKFHGTYGLPTALWFEIPPGSGLGSVLQRAPTGSIPERWFSPIRGTGDGAGRRARLATMATLAVARAAGAKLPWPEYLPLERADVIARWAGEALQRKGACVIRSHVSKSLRVCLAAKEAGIDLTGAIVTGGGEPPTRAKVAQIESSGAQFRSGYHFTEVGTVGLSCTASTDPNEQHLFLDHVALIQAPREVPGFELSVPSFHFTTLLPSAPKIMLNVESDDFGIVETRDCGCPFGEIGFTTHIRDIRSFRKLTGEGVTLVGSHVESILEEDLPAKFGGSPLDYQLIEEEDEQGFTRLTILVSPTVPRADEQAVVAEMQAALRRRGGAAELSRELWKQASTFRVRREAPRLTNRGKMMPLQPRSRPSSEPSAGARD
ncbi:MAG TPA: hypothetical protein VGQ52_13000 [Gemmatimonadaceae bacterium]|jgi:hypothetical protein|nr:hypothetical protein [Gemmatimonadaceae bacterium]